MKKVFHVIIGCTISLYYPILLWYINEEYVEILTGLLKDWRGFIINLLIIPYLILKSMNTTVLLIQRNFSTAAGEIVRILLFTIILISLVIWPNLWNPNDIINPLGVVVSYVDRLSKQYTYELLLLTILLYGVVFSIIPDNKYDNKLSPLHSIIVVLFISIVMLLIGLIFDPLKIILILLPLFVLCIVFHVIADFSSSEGAMILYPLYNKRLIRDVLKGSKRALRVASNIGEYLCLFISIISVLLYIMNISRLYAIGLEHVYSILLAYFTAICIPLPLLLLARARRRRYSLKPLRCNLCGRIIPPDTSTCPYCGESV